FSLATLAAFGSTRARTLLALVVALMLAMTLWLLFVQAFFLQAFCYYCLLSAVITFSLAGTIIAGRFIHSGT
ncbi:MAG TPA: vitamin K epoxide reductase family protein, partial [Pyrinomonadaceae bacterium]|nr:vitamin K epoxide reductase family protein [Pyrinomonadaceae bacterium]